MALPAELSRTMSWATRSERLEGIHRRHLPVLVVDGALEVIRPTVVDDDDRPGVAGGAPFVAREHRVKNEPDGDANREHDFPHISGIHAAPVVLTPREPSVSCRKQGRDSAASRGYRGPPRRAILGA